MEFLVSAEHKHDFVARESNPDILAAVDLVVDKLEQQVRRYKEKIQDHRRRPSTGEVAGAPSPRNPAKSDRRSCPGPVRLACRFAFASAKRQAERHPRTTDERRKACACLISWSARRLSRN